jgi:leucyl aminopeptidase
VPILAEQEMEGSAAALDEALGGQFGRLRERGDFAAKCAELLAIRDVPQIAADRLLLVGLGKLSDLTLAKLEKALRAAARQVSDKKENTAAVALPNIHDAGISADVCVQTATVAFRVGSVGQDLYKAEREHHPLESVTLLVEWTENLSDLQLSVERGAVLGDAINLTRDLVNGAPSDVYPESVAERAKKEADACGLTCTILGEPDLRRERMGSLLAVAQGSDRPPRVVILEHRGGGASAPTIALVGKGVTFDSGGLSIKPTDGMLTMKCDMAGAATVLGAMTAIARLKLPVNVIGYMGLVENLISGNSYKLGDVLTARNGVTIEVQNTDAEGRLVLADVLSYAVDKGATRIIDLATLTGACVVALGEEVVGAFANNQEWCDDVLAAAKACGEAVWQLPMVEEYGEFLKSDVADCKNVGPRWGGAITAAKFLEKFVSDTPWVHLDIAGPAFASSNKPYREGGATGCMVRTLVEVVGMK